METAEIRRTDILCCLVCEKPVGQKEYETAFDNVVICCECAYDLGGE